MDLACSKSCETGIMSRKRFCRFEPCFSEDAKTILTEQIIQDSNVLCNTFPCEKSLNGMATVRAKSSENGEFDKFCQFPFIYQEKIYKKCIDEKPPTESGLLQFQGSGKWCGLISDLDVSVSESRVEI